ncbi:hypothetical protein DFH11DRAFT_1545597 [Phellopilus nigrolimitatus]|nr:hypothetical protein DFH11DRAFT_1545597 [Phellopilus nigrolimitatus]
MAPRPAIRRRDASDNSGSGIQIGSAYFPIFSLVGLGIAVLAVLVLVVWLSVIVCRRRARRKRQNKRGPAFLIVKGVIKEPSLGMKQSGFSRANLTPSIVMPDKTTIRSDATADQVLEYYTEQGKLPRPFAPFSFALNAAQKPASSSSSSSPEPQDNRISTLSFSASAARLPSSRSHASLLSSVRDSVADSFFFGGQAARPGSALSAGTRASVLTASSFSLSTGVQARRVHQVFTPILPDEPTLVPGERVTVMRAFDDGWCVVARAASYGAPGEAELGAVPAWCFVRPMKGLRSERPVRSSSLGVTLQIDNDERPRDDIISWSNF